MISNTLNAIFIFQLHNIEESFMMPFIYFKEIILEKKMHTSLWAKFYYFYRSNESKKNKRNFLAVRIL